jgi:hypothetical protein
MSTQALPYFFLFFILSNVVIGQGDRTSFLVPSDSLHVDRKNAIVYSEVGLSSAAFVGLYSLWYKEYPRSSFHTKNDFGDWLQVDKAGHVYSSYQLGRFSSELFQWAGMSGEQRLLYGATYGFVFLTAVEIFDGFSKEWGFSWSDIGANALGSGLYVTQELLWKEQRMSPKFSFHTSKYAIQNPKLLGTSFSEQVLKDYNGQTYWLSVNLHSFAKESNLPKWLNLAVGYGAEGMISSVNDTTLSNSTQRARQFYLSFDVDLTRIETKSPLLRTIFSVFNSIKIPAPALELSVLNGFQFYPFYF